MTLSHAEFQAAALEASAQVDAERDAAFAAAAAQRSDAADEHATRTAELRQAHEAESEARIIAFQKFAAKQFAPVVETACTDPSRPNIAALVATFEQVDAEGQRMIGRGVYAELLHAVSEQIAKAVGPSAYVKLGNEGNFDGFYSGVTLCNQRLLDALRQPGNVAGVQMAFADLERALAAICANGVGNAARGEARWQIIKFGGSFDHKVAALKAFDKRCFDEDHGTDAERQARHGHWEEATRVREPSETIAAAFRRVTDAALAKLRPVPSEPPAPPAPPKRPTPPAPLPVGP